MIANTGLGRIAAASAVCAVLASGCTSTTTGTATPAATGVDAGANVALMDTGTYDTASSRPFGSAGDDIDGAKVLEAHRMADFVVAPWEVDAELVNMPGALSLGMIGPIPTLKIMRNNGVLKDDLIAVAEKHSFVTGFSTVRLSPETTGQPRSLHNVVLRFPDPAAAEATATEMAAAEAARPGEPTPEPAAVPNTPEALAFASTIERPGGKPGEGTVNKVVSFTAHGPYLLYQEAQTAQAFLGTSALGLVDGALVIQKRRIDEFTPTDLGAMRDLPIDPSGQLLAKTLTAPDGGSPFMIGVWNANAWLNFELKPLQAKAVFSTAGVDLVSQRLTTVYQAANADGATRIVDSLVDELSNLPWVRDIDGVTGLPGARCFHRTQGGLPGTSPATWQRVVWQFKCVASVDRYAYTAFSADVKLVRQQMAAQYRILSGQ